MNTQPRLQQIEGLVTAFEWDQAGHPIQVKLCCAGEVDYFFIENSFSADLLECVRSWIRVRGKVLLIDAIKLIEVTHLEKDLIEEKYEVY